MVSESDLLTRLREILSASDLDTATAGSVRRELEKHFGADLSDRKAFIRDQIDIYLESQVVANPPEAEEDVAEEEEEEAGEGSENAEQNDDVKAEDDVEEEEEPVGKARRKKAPKKVDKGGAKRGGFKTVYSLSPQLQVVVGEPEMARPEVVKKIWAYIREKDLQDPKNRRNIICDDALHAVFRVKSIDMFKMNKVLSKHIWPLNRDDEPVKKTKKVEESDHSISEGDASNVDEQEAEDEEEVVKEKGSNRKQTKKRRSAKVDKEVKKRGGGFTKLSSLSPELQKVTGVSELARTEVVKKLWNYIRENNMQDPNNKKVIICDELFRNLFEVDSIDMFQMNKALSKHIWPLNQEAALDNDSQTEKQSGHEQEDSDEADHDEKRQKKEIENT
ncbi:upstream activation factor subunit spp27-like isoform X2 [Argentina anserina]|uniref:upstream activation factor subunit spp27-like isoform X2 n=1 Tax=Argentina anserina TaxID=57926 RepID=UPI0021766865|nr:upstream activation factor subunit spp27-like isoform X2 [Potentilla anserina]